MLASFLEVLSDGPFDLVKALPASSRTLVPEEGFSKTFAASFAIFGLVPFLMSHPVLDFQHSNLNRFFLLYLPYTVL